MRSAGAVILAAVLLGTGSAAGQVVERTGRGDPRLDERIDRIIDANYRILTRDTLIRRGESLQGPVFAAGIRLMVEGRVVGEIAGVDANIYIRPTARVEGDVLNIAGGLYKSEQATITGGITDEPLAPYHIEQHADTIIIVGDVDQHWFRLEGFKGALIPTANRVDGITPRVGLAIVPTPAGRVEPEIGFWAGYAFERDGFENSLQGGIEARLKRGLTTLFVGAERSTYTQDAWIRSDALNTLSFLYKGKDYRNYYDADRYYGGVRRRLARGTHIADASIRLQRENATSVREGDPWVLLAPDSLRINPGIDDGILTSGIVSVAGEWEGLRNAAEYDASVELAASTLLDGEFDFAGFYVHGEYALQGIANHTLEFEGRFQGPLPGSDPLPRQRWGIIGGSGTLYTFEVGEFRGPNVAFFGSEYSIPMPARTAVPFLGAPRISVLHNMGMAWTDGSSRDWEQNVGMRVRFAFVNLRAVIDPRNPEKVKFSAGLTTPKKARPWEKKR